MKARRKILLWGELFLACLGSTEEVLCFRTNRSARQSMWFLSPAGRKSMMKARRHQHRTTLSAQTSARLRDLLREDIRATVAIVDLPSQERWNMLP